MTAMQRSKGQRGEREFCKTLGEYLGESIQRQIDAARAGGPDVLLGNLWAIEVKRGERERLKEWWKQAIKQAADYYHYPALAYRANGQPWRVIVPLDILLWGHQQWDTTNDLHYTATLSVPGFATVIHETTKPGRTRA